MIRARPKVQRVGRDTESNEGVLYFVAKATKQREWHFFCRLLDDGITSSTVSPGSSPGPPAKGFW